jgi:hypothetical protein
MSSKKDLHVKFHEDWMMMLQLEREREYGEGVENRR